MRGMKVKKADLILANLRLKSYQLSSMTTWYETRNQHEESKTSV